MDSEIVKKREKRSGSVIVTSSSTKENVATKSKSGSGIFSRSSKSPLNNENEKSSEVPKLGSIKDSAFSMSWKNVADAAGAIFSPRGSRSNSIVGNASPFSPRGKKEVTLEEEFNKLSQELAAAKFGDTLNVRQIALNFADCIDKFPPEKQGQKLMEHECHKLQAEIEALWNQVRMDKDPSCSSGEEIDDYLRPSYEKLESCYKELFEKFPTQDSIYVEGFTKVGNVLRALSAKSLVDKNAYQALANSINTPKKVGCSTKVSVVFMDEMKGAFGFFGFNQQQFIENLLALFKHFFQARDSLEKKPLDTQSRKVAFEIGVQASFFDIKDGDLEQWRKCLSSASFGQFYGSFSLVVEHNEVLWKECADGLNLMALSTLVQLMDILLDKLNYVLEQRKLPTIALDFLKDEQAKITIVDEKTKVTIIDEKTKKMISGFVDDYLAMIFPEAGVLSPRMNRK